MVKLLTAYALQWIVLRLICVWPDQLWRASSSPAIYDHMTWLLPPKHFTTGLVSLVVQYASVSYWWPSSQRDRMAATILAVVYLHQMLMSCYNILQNNVLMYSVILWINCSALLSTVAYIYHMDPYAVMTTTTCISLMSAITLCEAGCYVVMVGLDGNMTAFIEERSYS